MTSALREITTKDCTVKGSGNKSILKGNINVISSDQRPMIVTSTLRTTATTFALSKDFGNNVCFRG